LDVKQNDLNNPNRIVGKGDIFGYNYNTIISNGSAWAQAHHNYQHLEFFYAAKLAVTSYFRDGKMRNGRYPNSSFGKGAVHNFIDPAVKAGIIYKIDGRNLLSANGMFKTQAPNPYDAYTSPKVSDEAIPNLSSEKIATADLNYVFTYPKINGRISGFYTGYWNGTSKISYYSDVDRTFLHHSISGVNKLNYGAEAAVQYNVWKNLTLTLAGTWSNFTYTNNPMGTVRYENGTSEDLDENVAIKGFHVGGSPEIAGTFGIQYFWDYWWFEVNVNAIGNNYIDPSYIQRTPSIKERVYDRVYNNSILEGKNDAIAENLAYNAVQDYTKQTKLDNTFTVDLSISKLIYFKGGKQLNINLSVANILNNTKVRTGGYEQGRVPMTSTGEFDIENQDKFAPKYYYMQGVNVFLNIGFKF
jgi:hypothetical protein